MICRFQVAQILEGDQVSVVTTPVESSDTDTIDSTSMEPAEELSLLGGSSSANCLSSKSKQDVSDWQKNIHNCSLSFHTSIFFLLLPVLRLFFSLTQGFYFSE